MCHRGVGPALPPAESEVQPNRLYQARAELPAKTPDFIAGDPNELPETHPDIEPPAINERQGQKDVGKPAAVMRVSGAASCCARLQAFFRERAG